MMPFLLVVNTRPMSKQRPRMSRKGRVFTPPQTRRYEQLIRTEARKEWGPGPPYMGVCAIRVDCFFERPKTIPKGHPCHSGPVEAFPLGMGSSRYPDASNALKAAEDALNKVVYNDDSQVHEAACARWWAAKGEGSRVVISVWIVGGER